MKLLSLVSQTVYVLGYWNILRKSIIISISENVSTFEFLPMSYQRISRKGKISHLTRQADLKDTFQKFIQITNMKY